MSAVLSAKLSANRGTGAVFDPRTGLTDRQKGGFVRVLAMLVAAIGLLVGVAGAQSRPEPRRAAPNGARVGESRLRSIEIDGPHSVPTARLVGWTGLTVGARLPRPRWPESVNGAETLVWRRLAESGFLYAARPVGLLDFSPDSTEVTLRLSVEEGGEPLPLSSLDWVSADSLGLPSEALRSAMDTRVGRPLDWTALERDLAAMTASLSAAGFPLAAVTVESLTLRDSGGVALTLRLDRGGRVSLSEVTVVGNTSTRRSVILREARLRPGEPFSDEAFGRIRERLDRTGYFTSVAEPQLYVTPSGEAGVRLAVEEGGTTGFDGIVGYNPGDPATGRKGELTGLLNLNVRNLLGTGRRLSVRWEQEPRASRSLAFGYTEPWVAGLPVDLSGSFGERRQDSSYVRRDLKGTATLRLGERVSGDLTASRESVAPTLNTYLADLADRAIFPVLGSQTVFTGAALRFDSRDSRLNPRHGVTLVNSYELGRKRISLPDTLRVLQPSLLESVTINRLVVDGWGYIPTFRRQLIAIGLHGGAVRTDQLDRSDLFRLGGTNTLRGYRENEFEADRFAYLNLEYRLQLARDSYTYLFSDLGYLRSQAQDATGLASSPSFRPTELHRTGVGFGIRLRSGLGIIGVSYALGDEKRQFTRGKIHFGLINEF